MIIHNFTKVISIIAIALIIVFVFSFALSAVIYAADNVDVTFEINGSARGNIFDECGQIFSVLIHNESEDSKNVSIRYFVYDEENRTVVQNRIESGVIGANSDKSIEIKTNIKIYGLYSLKAEALLLTGTSLTSVYEDTVPFSVINKTTDGNVNLDFGVSAHLDRFGDQNENIDIIRSAGFGIIRSELEWYYVEREAKNVLKIPSDKGRFQAYVKQNGMDNIMILGFSSKYWVTDDDGNASPSTPPSTDEQMEAFARYCAFMAEQYKDSIEYFEIWNEYNLVNFNIPNYDGAMYAKMLKYAYPAIKTANPNAKVVGMSLAGLSLNNSKYGTSWDVFLRQALDAGAGNFFDILSIHFYQHNYEGFYSEEFFRDQKVKPLKEIMKEYGISDKPIWQTETGWSTMSGNGAKYTVSEKEQALYGVKLYLFSKAEKLWDRLFWYDYQNDGANPSEEQNNYGITDAASGVKVSGRAKASFVAFAAMNKLMANAEYKNRIQKNGADILWFDKPNGESIAVLWKDGAENEKITVSTGAQEIKVLDMYSNVIKEMQNSEGVYTIEYGNEPIYLCGNFIKFEEAEEEKVQISCPDKKVFTDSVPKFTVRIYGENDEEYKEYDIKRELFKDGELIKTQDDIIKIEKKSVSYTPFASFDFGEGNYTIVITASNSNENVSVTKDYTVVNADNSSFCEISYDESNGKICVYGKTQEINKEVSIRVVDKIENKNLYFGQTTSSDSGEYFFYISGIDYALPLVTVNDGRITQKEFDEPRAKISLTHNSDAVTDVKALHDGDSIEVKAQVESADAGKPLDIVIAAYDTENKLLWADVKSIEAAEILNKTSVIMRQAADTKRMACFVWKKGMMPATVKYDTDDLKR